MSSSLTKKRSRKSNFSPKKKTKTVHCCQACDMSFSEVPHFKSHIKDNPSCRQSSHTFSCSYCKYFGLNNSGLTKHLSLSPSCNGLYNQFKTTQGHLPDIDKEICFDSMQVDDDGVVTSSYNITRVAANRVVDSILVHIKDGSAAIRKEVHNQLELYQNNLTTYLKNNRALAGMHNNTHFPIIKDVNTLTPSVSTVSDNNGSGEIELEFNILMMRYLMNYH